MDIDPGQFAKAMANRVVRERGRIALRVEEFAAQIVPYDDRNAAVRDQLYAYAAELRENAPRATPEIVATPATQVFNTPDPDPVVTGPLDESELPPVRHMDDFAEGMALVRMSPSQRNVHGYPGAMGGLARD